MLGMTACKPVEIKEPYGVFVLGDVQAVKDERNKLARRVSELVHENALLSEKLDRERREKAYGDGYTYSVR